MNIAQRHLSRLVPSLLFASVHAALPLNAREYNVRSCGAMGDGRALDTAAIQKAVDTCAADGGGIVRIPAGRYLTGPVFLKSDVQVQVDPGAVILGSTNFADYPVVNGRWEGIERKIYASVFTGHGLHNVSITGRGVIDGQGAVWWNAFRKSMDLRKKKGIKGREPDNPPEAPLRWPRPRLINLYNCTNVLLRDLTIQNSPSWQVHPVYCESVTIDNVTILAPDSSPNTDAIDPDSCRNVRISNCHFSVGDDCIVIKSGYNEDGRRVGIPCENIVVCNCTFAQGHGGIVIGSEMSGSVRNVTVVNCVFDGTRRGIRVKTAPGRGGTVEYFRASNLIMRNVPEAALSVTAAYADTQSNDKAGAAPETVPHLRHFYWGDITVVDANKVADLSALADALMEDVRIARVQVIGAKSGIRCEHAKGVVLEDITLQPQSGPAVEAQHVAGLEVCRLAMEKPNTKASVLQLRDVTRAFVHNCNVTSGPGTFVQSAGGGSKDLILENNRLGQGVEERAP